MTINNGFTVRGHKWRDAFIAALNTCPVVAQACKTAGIDRTSVYALRKTDETFAKEWDDAIENAIDLAEQEAFRRGVTGFTEPVIHKGQLSMLTQRVEDEEGNVTYQLVLDERGQPVPLTVRKHSDALLITMLKGRRKQLYADRTELTGGDGGPVAVDGVTRAARVAQLLAIAKARSDAPADPDFSDLA